MLTFLAAEVDVVMLGIVFEEFDESFGAFGGSARKIQVAG